MNTEEIVVIENRLDTTKDVAEIHQVFVKKSIQVPKRILVNVFDPNGVDVGQIEVTSTQKVIQKEFRRKLSPKYDPNKQYLPRSSRKEWHVIGLLGVVKVLPEQPINSNWIWMTEEGKYQLYLVK